MNDKQLPEGTDSFQSYHQRNCKICRHPDRPAIEYDFVNWRSPDHIAYEYKFSTRSLYRHANALNLFEQRRRNLRSSLELIIETAGRVPSSADSVLRAIQLYARMNEHGELMEVPKTQVIVISRDGTQAAMLAASAAKIVQNVTPNAQLAELAAPFEALLAQNAAEMKLEAPLSESRPPTKMSELFGPACQPVTQSQTEIDLNS
jgi:hypothetical protein